MTTLYVMAKRPRMGAVKTRLAREIGVADAARAYRLLLRDTMRAAADPRWRTVLAVTPDHGEPLPRVAWVAQGPGDLGARMQRLLDRAPPGPAVIIGSDIAGITAAHIARAFAALGQADAVFGPARDGGFWLAGAKRVPRVPRLFGNVRWSHPETLADALKNGRGLEVALIDELEDVDDAASWRRWRSG